MTKFAKFDKTNLKALRAEMQNLLSKYGIDANVAFEVGNMKFSESDVEIKVKATIVGAKSFTNILLETRANALGLKLINKAGDELVDYNPRAYKMPFVYRSAADGKRYKTSEQGASLRFRA